MKLIIVHNKDGSPMTICEIPVMSVENAKGKTVKPEVSVVRSPRPHSHRTKTVPVDIRVIPVPDASGSYALAEWVDANDLTGCGTTIMDGDTYRDAIVVAIVAPQFLPFLKTNLNLAKRSLYYSILTDTDYADHIVEILAMVMDEVGIDDKHIRQVLMLHAHEASRCYNASVPGAQGEPSALQYSATMLAITAYVCGCSPKDIIMADYKIMGGVANETLRNIKWSIKHPDK